MVSSGTVNSDLSSVTSCIGQFQSGISGLSGSWQGASFDGLQSKVNEAVDLFNSTLKGQMTSFASACELYIEYKQTKDDLQVARSNYNSQTENKSKYQNQINTLQTKLNDLKSQIESLLASVSGPSVASSSSSSSVTTSTDTSSSIATSTMSTTTTSLGGASSNPQLQNLKEGTYTKVDYMGSNGRQISTYIYVPANANSTSGLSTMLSLGGDGSKLDHGGALTAGVGKALANGANYSGLVVVLEAENDKSYSDGRYLDTAKELTDNVVKKYNANPNKISVSGYSYGGFGTVHLLERFPNYFSQGVILAAGDGPVGKESSSKAEGYEKLKNTKIHLICGTADSNYSGMASLLEHLKSGGKVTYNFVPNKNHEINHTGSAITVNGQTYSNYIEFCLAQTK